MNENLQYGEDGWDSFPFPFFKKKKVWIKKFQKKTRNVFTN
jgi:hypothetical protein